jgi:hypothetical protein
VQLKLSKTDPGEEMMLPSLEKWAGSGGTAETAGLEETAHDPFPN